MKKFSSIIPIALLLTFASCSQKTNTSQDGSFNDTLAVTKLLVQEIRNDLSSKIGIDSITEEWHGKLCTVHYRVDKSYMLYQSISMVFGDINCDSLNDAIATIMFYTGGNRDEFTHAYVERTSEGYQLKERLPLFGYRYIDINSIKNCVLELKGKSWKSDDPMCCPSIIEEFKVKLVGETFEKYNDNTEQEAIDPNAAEFEKAKQEAESMKQKFEFEKHGLYKLSFLQGSQTEEMKSSSTFYFDSQYFLKYFVEISEYAGGGGEAYSYYSWEGLILKYSHNSDASGSFISIWFNQHQYEEVIDASGDKKYKNDIVEIDNNLEFDRWKQYLEDKSKQEFTYDSDSSCYKLSTQNAPDWIYELRVDSALFVHLFGDK